MRHPSELLIVSLLVDNKSDDQVRNTVLEYGLPPITDEQLGYLADLRARVRVGRPAKFDGSHAEDKKYLRTLQIERLYTPDALTLTALRYLSLPVLRRDIFMGLVGRVDTRDLCAHLSARHNIDLNADVLRTIRHYFYNVDHVGIHEWTRYLDEEDPATAELLACAHGGPLSAAYRLGMERNVQIKDAVYAVVSAVQASVAEMRDWETSPAKVRALAEAMSTLARAHAVINTSDQELAAVAAELRQFKLARSLERPKPLALLPKEMRALPAPARKESILDDDD